MGTGSGRTALILTLLTWVSLFVLSLLEGRAFDGVKIPFVYDLGAHARFLCAVPVLVLADIPIGTRLRQVVRHFVTARLVRVGELAGVIVVVLAYAQSYNAVAGFSFQSGSTWFRPETGQGLTTVGYWYTLVALPILQFLVFRWAYRMVVWGRFLWTVSDLDLALVPTHPDGAGGLAFLGKGLIPFGTVLFALSAAVAGTIASQILFGGHTLEEYQSSYAALFIVALAVFAGPTLVFMPKLLGLKQRGLLEYGVLGSEYTQAFQRRWIERTDPTEETLLGSGDIQSLADLGGSFEIIRKMRIVPVAFGDFVAMLLPGLLPALPLAATVMPVGDILKGLLKLVT